MADKSHSTASSGKELPRVSQVTPSTVIRLKRKHWDKTETEGVDTELPSPPKKIQRIVWDLEETDKELSRPSKTSPSTKIQFSCPSEKKDRTKIWIIGSSYIRRAEDAAYENFGQSFGLNAQVQWFGKGGLRWSGVLPRFYAELANTQSPPDVLVIHAGGNDLGQVPALELVSTMEQELTQLCAEFPTMKIVYSCINQRQKWRYLQPWKANNARKTVNKVMRKAVQKLGGEVVEHPLLQYSDKTVFLADGVHFTDSGNAIFVTSIHSVLNKILRRTQ